MTSLRSVPRIGPFPTRPIDVGVIHDLATHDMDLTTWVTGQHYTSIAARTAHRSAGPQEDLLAALGQRRGHHRPPPGRLDLSLAEHVTVITGENGCIIADTLTTILTHWPNRPVEHHALHRVNSSDVIRYAINKTEPLRTEHEAFRNTVLGHRSAAAPLQDGLRAVLVADAALQAVRTRTTIAIASASTNPQITPAA